jgi:hypothetical protein
VGTGQARENGEIVVVVQDAKNPKRRQATISTLREISPQNYASPSGRSMTRKPKKWARPVSFTFNPLQNHASSHLPNRRLNDTFN